MLKKGFELKISVFRRAEQSSVLASSGTGALFFQRARRQFEYKTANTEN
jgi:hypothetical protein